jgi:hypothetical protein
MRCFASALRVCAPVFALNQKVVRLKICAPDTSENTAQREKRATGQASAMLAQECNDVPRYTRMFSLSTRTSDGTGAPKPKLGGRSKRTAAQRISTRAPHAMPRSSCNAAQQAAAQCSAAAAACGMGGVRAACTLPSGRRHGAGAKRDAANSVAKSLTR